MVLHTVFKGRCNRLGVWRDCLSHHLQVRIAPPTCLWKIARMLAIFQEIPEPQASIHADSRSYFTLMSNQETSIHAGPVGI